ncbi:putative beta-lactamase-like 1 [Exaiptasia diaphana]|uniref:Beta-lactamase-related domain-containing protein n=1 Tax=Exaiptasia diaphana TaxID=2652724 RepID=A0A913XMP4_EXADI|nr:putative beta-lactamase-like 1 [Exaiptasia diaphana]KXJ20212.1 putative beta-lactamase-like 1 [Exaiptasia diaphana]
MAVSPTKVSSMENLVPEETYRKSKQAYIKIVAALFIACVIAVVMTCLFAWKISEDTTSAPAKSSPVRGVQTNNDFCPGLPPILPKLPSPLPEELQASLRTFSTYLGNLVQENGLPAISANAYYKDSILWKGHYGRKTLDGERPDDTTRYRIGSISKIFPVLMVYMLYEQGIISSIDDPLNKYVPDFVINNPFTNESITLRQIMNQLSGLPREAPCVLCNRNETTEEQLMFLKNQSLVVDPGTVPSYSNLGYALLGRLFTERVIKNTTFEEWTKDNILSPLGLNHTGFSFTSDVKKNMAFPYDKQGQLLPILNIGWLSPSGQMYSTIEELARVGMFLMGSKKSDKIGIKQSSLREMLAPSYVAPDGLTMWGSPWEIFLREHFIIRTKGGSIDGMSAMMVVIPEVKLGFNVFLSAVANFSVGALIGNTITDRFIKDFLPVFNSTLFTINEEGDFPVKPKLYTGTYNITRVNIYAPTDKILNYQATITASGSKLIYKDNGGFPEVSLYYIGYELILQGKVFSSSCFTQRMGTVSAFHFKPAGADGLSPGFAVPQMGISSVRVSV